MGCQKLSYHLAAEPRLRCVYNAADGEEYCVDIRTYLGGNYEHEVSSGTTPTDEKWKWWWIVGDILTGGMVTATITTSVAAVAGTTYTTTILNTPILFIGGSIDQDWERGRQLISQSWKINNGLFYTDPNKDFWGQTWELVSRFSWEAPQSTAGYYYTQGRNAIGHVDRVDFFAGATWATRENESHRGISLGNFINMSMDGEITGSFQDYVLNDPWFMHEYGHRIQSRHWGTLYLFGVGIPSALVGNDLIPNDPLGRAYDDIEPIEMKANNRAAKYFGKYYGVDWDYLGNKKFYKFPLEYYPPSTGKGLPWPTRRR